MEPTVALQLAGRNYDVLIDTGFSGLLLAYAYPDHLYDTSTFYNNAEFETPPSLLPEIQWAVVADARPVQTWVSRVPVVIGTKEHSLQLKIICADPPPTHMYAPAVCLTPRRFSLEHHARQVRHRGGCRIADGAQHLLPVGAQLFVVHIHHHAVEILVQRIVQRAR